MPVFASLAAVAFAETPSHSRTPGNIWVRVRVSFTTGAVRSAILATAGLLVLQFIPWHDHGSFETLNPHLPPGPPVGFAHNQ